MVCRLNPILNDLSKDMSLVCHKTSEMGTIADKMNITIQDLTPIMEKLEKLKSQYRKELQSVCEHEWITDSFENCSRNDEYGVSIDTIVYCVNCEKRQRKAA